MRSIILTRIIVSGFRCIFKIGFYFNFTSQKRISTIPLSQKFNSIISTNVREQLLRNLSVFFRYYSTMFNNILWTQFWPYVHVPLVVWFKILILKFFFSNLITVPVCFSILRPFMYIGLLRVINLVAHFFYWYLCV